MSRQQLKYGIRNSKMLLNEVYFWTDTIKDWNTLLEDNHCKTIIISCWKELIIRKKICIYGFVITPNHLHILWEMLEKNGKETPYASFNKFTSHQFLDTIREQSPKRLNRYQEITIERKHRFWQRDPLAITIKARPVAEQKLDYIHLSLLQRQWSLVQKPEDYKWLSARFYETGEDEFGILTHHRARF